MGMKGLVTGLLATLALTCSFAASAGQVMRVVHFTAASAEQQKEVVKLVDSEIDKAYHGAKGFKWVKYLVDSKTLGVGSVSLWDNKADVEAFLTSDTYKGIAAKLKLLMTGTMSSDIYEVYTPKK
jgi:heme-degrading monooxygenase HmoA